MAKDIATEPKCLGDENAPDILHFTYTKPKPESTHLQQGDILIRTPEMEEILDKAHPHYLEEKYTHFMVLTQSCDLVRRNNRPCKSRYISIAAIRPLRFVLKRAIEAYQQDELDKIAVVCGDENKIKVRQFLERLLNNNEPDYFYLHETAQFSLVEDSCAFLRLSIALRASDHYETCFQARILSLDEVFQAKLGWLVGNLYSRVGTEDWVPITVTQKDFDRIITDKLEESCEWVNREILKIARKQWKGDDQRLGDRKNKEEARSFIKQISVKSRPEQIAERVLGLLKEIGLVKDNQQANKIMRLLADDSKLKSLVK